MDILILVKTLKFVCHNHLTRFHEKTVDLSLVICTNNEYLTDFDLLVNFDDNPFFRDLIKN